MDHDAIIKKLLTALSNMTVKDLQQLSLILDHPNSEKTIKDIIDGIISLRKIEAAKTPANDKKHEGRTSKADNRNDKTAINELKSNSMIDHLTKILNDKSIFPKTIDLIESLNNAFRFNIKYEDFYKRGRRDLIQKYKKLITALPKNEQKRRITSFLQSIQNDRQESDAYQKLFKILSGNGNNS